MVLSGPQRGHSSTATFVNVCRLHSPARTQMSEPYLILHKVRGEPAFDVAEKVGEDDDGEVWIIPTSGHRAYPYEWRALMREDHYFKTTIPADWPDHYSCNDRPAKPEPSRGSRLLEKLGLVKP